MPNQFMTLDALIESVASHVNVVGAEFLVVAEVASSL